LQEKRTSDGRGCGCNLSCRTKRCMCRKNGQFCGDACKCRTCENIELQVPQSTTGDNYLVGSTFVLWFHVNVCV